MLDTNVLVGALIGRAGYNRAVLRACFEDRLIPLIGQNLFLEYEDVMGREHLFRNSPLNAVERTKLFAAFLKVCEWVSIHYYWRPNLRDESDNHVMELAVAGGATAIVTNNIADFRRADLRFPEVAVLTPSAILEQLS